MRRGFAAVVLSCGALAQAAAADPASDREPVRLVRYAQMADGKPVDGQGADSAINPASVTKLATSLWALERLGPDHRFETRFASAGELDLSSGVLNGDLLVLGSGDPDFHVENAYLVARALNQAGLKTVRGRLLLNDAFWIGWEGGSERRETDRGQRIALMASRLRDAIDPKLWSRDTRRYLGEFVARREIEGQAPRVVVQGSVGAHAGRGSHPVLLRHRSGPLRATLKRFNAYSNNDIERLGFRLGTGVELAEFLAARWEVPPATLKFESLSGLGKNRMTPRLVVRLLEDLGQTLRELDLRLEDVLPAVGCDPGTLTHFPRLSEKLAGALVAKTGTLTKTDGGVAVLAGVAHTARGPLLFCVAAPGSGRRLVQARDAQERWLLDLIGRHGGPRPHDCGAAVGYSDDRAQVLPGDP